MNHCKKSYNAASIATQAAAAAAAYFEMNNQNLQFPSLKQFDAIVNDYLQKLSTKKRDKALVDSHRYSMILKVLKDPKNTSVSTAQFRFWVKKMFSLSNKKVCHDNKPVATRENMYPILVAAHKEAHHGGRDKTSALVRKQYSWIPKELIARFVRHCPYCISKRVGKQEPKTPPVWNSSSIVTSSFMASDPSTSLYYPTKQEAGDVLHSYEFECNTTQSCSVAAAVVAAAAMAAIKSNYSTDSL